MVLGLVKGVAGKVVVRLVVGGVLVFKWSLVMMMLGRVLLELIEL